MPSWLQASYQKRVAVQAENSAPFLKSAAKTQVLSSFFKKKLSLKTGINFVITLTNLFQSIY
jgi:hypothetical protein